MGDSMDRVQERVQEELEQQVILVTGRPTQVSNFFCEDCDAAIPEIRLPVECSTGGHRQPLSYL